MVERRIRRPSQPRQFGVRPVAPDRPEHVAAHHVSAARSKNPVGHRFVCVIHGLIKVPAVQRQAPDADRVLLTLVRTSHEAIE